MITNHQTGECSLVDCFCHEAQQKELPPSTAIPAPDFEREWAQAPASHKHYTEQSDAFYWFTRGVRCGELNQMLEENRVFRGMAELRGLGR